MPEDIGFTTRVKSFFVDHQPPHPPKPALSEHSTSNPATSSDYPRFQSPPVPAIVYTTAAMDPPAAAQQAPGNEEEEEDEEEEEEEDEEEEEEAESDSEAETGARNPQGAAAAAEQSELMQLEMSEDIRLGSPDDGSNNLDSDFHMLTVNNQAGLDPADHQRRVAEFRAESSRRWQMMQETPRNAIQSPPTGSQLILSSPYLIRLNRFYNILQLMAISEQDYKRNSPLLPALSRMIIGNLQEVSGSIFRITPNCRKESKAWGAN